MSQTTETAYVKTSSRAASRSVYHTDETCTRLEEAYRYREATESEVRSFRVCKECAGTSDRTEGGPNAVLTCPVCGDQVRNLPNHLRACP